MAIGNMHKNLAKIGRVVLELCMWTTDAVNVDLKHEAG